MLAVMLFVGLHTIGFVSKRWDDRLNTTPWTIRALMYAALGLLLFYGWPSQSSAFIYFQF